jgi:hypothetical protein
VTQPALQNLAAAAGAVAKAWSGQGPGRPVDVFTPRIVRQLLRITEEATGRRVTIGKGKDSNENPRLTGAGGEFIRRCFEIVEPTLGDSSLVKHVREGRQQLKNPEVLQEDRNSLEMVKNWTIHGRVEPF